MYIVKFVILSVPSSTRFHSLPPGPSNFPQDAHSRKGPEGYSVSFVISITFFVRVLRHLFLFLTPFHLFRLILRYCVSLVDSARMYIHGKQRKRKRRVVTFISFDFSKRELARWDLHFDGVTKDRAGTTTREWSNFVAASTMLINE